MSSGFGFDWLLTNWPTIQSWLHGGNPYGPPLYPGMGFFNPPWLLPLQAPLALFPPIVGAWGMALISTLGMVALCIKLKHPWIALLVACSLPMLEVIWNGTVEGFVLWGLVIGGPIGLLLISIKPQVAGLVALVWVCRAWKESGWRGVARLVSPTAAVAAISTILYPQWIGAMFGAHQSAFQGNFLVNLFPWLVLPALGLLALALKRYQSRYAEECAVLATNWASPYLHLYSYSAAVTQIACDFPAIGVLMVVLPWAYVIVTHQQLY